METNFKFHLYAGLVSFVLIYIFLQTYFVNIEPKLIIIAFFTFLVGALIPDVDCDWSVPRRYLNLAIGISVASLSGYILWLNKLSTSTILLNSFLVFLASYILVKSHHLRHRTDLHNVKSATVYGVTTTALITYFLNLNANAIGFLLLFSFLGYLTHLVVDKI